MRKIFLNLIIALIGIVITLAIIELVFRFVQKTPPRSPRSERPHLYFLPDTALSAQDAAPLSPKPHGTFRMAVVGDSFSFAPGMQYDDAFAKRLERFLNLNQNAPRVEVLNYGTPGYSTANEVKEVQKAISNQADLIIVQITLNDAQLKPLNQETEEVQRRFGRLKTNFNDFFILRHWQSLKFVVERLHNQQTIQSYIQYHHDLFQQPESWNRFSTAFSEIKKVADQAEVPVIAVLFPLFDFPIDASYPFTTLHKKIAEYLQSLRIPLLDLRTAFSGLSMARLQLKPGQDSHPNEIAHRIAAERILLWVARKKLVPQSALPRKVFTQREHIKEPPFDWMSKRGAKGKPLIGDLLSPTTETESSQE